MPCSDRSSPTPPGWSPVAQRRGVALPPIHVVGGTDGYYVLDGRHRVSVALGAGRREIAARVS